MWSWNRETETDESVENFRIDTARQSNSEPTIVNLRESDS
jgi:hypothetical protein